MKKQFLLLAFLVVAAVAITLHSCTSHEDNYVPVSPVVLDITQVPYPKLSDYKFFEGDLKDQKPAYKVIPYKPASELFSDYAHKKRFVWMQDGTTASYNGDDNVLDFPVGAVLIKTFYYPNVLPANTEKIIETRLLVKIAEATPTDSGWMTYDYIWNEDQTDALLDVSGNGMNIPITFMENNVEKTANYRIPASSQCTACHKLDTEGTGNPTVIPIGPKPQNLNFNLNYGTSTRNQLQKWQSEGYINSSIPATITSTVDWQDESQPLELRARSYIDANCAHCHRTGAYCDYTPSRLNFSNTDPYLLGICMPPSSSITGNPFIINSGLAGSSDIITRMVSQNGSVMMPLIGRNLVHEEAVDMMKNWINSMEGHCN